MRKRILGKTGIEVSELAFGSLFTSSLGPGFDDSKQAVHKAIDLGINYFDTAPAYANSEEIFGKIIADIKTPIILSTKLGGRPQFTHRPGSTYILADDGLNAVDLGSGDRTMVTAVKGPGWYFQDGAVPVDDIRISPDGKWLLVAVAQQLHLVAVPATGTTIDLTPIAALADAPTLVAHLNQTLMHGSLTPDAVNEIVIALNATSTTSDPLALAKSAGYLLLTSPHYQVIR